MNGTTCQVKTITAKRMISAIETTAGKANVPIYQLKVVLLDSEPSVWRRLQVPGDATLDWLHATFQVTIGWTNSHLHQFRVAELLVFFRGRSLVEPKRVVVRKVDFSLWPDTGRGMPGGAKAAGPAVCQASGARVASQQSPILRSAVGE